MSRTIRRAKPGNASIRHIHNMRVKMNICPVTGGAPTTMTPASFMAACTFHRSKVIRSVKGWYTVSSWCDRCQGNLKPKELRLVSINTLKRRTKRENAEAAQ